MLTAVKQKLISSLQQKKFRNQHQLFVIEGVKIISEFVTATNLISEIYITNNQILDNSILHIASSKQIKIIVTDEKTIKKISSLTTPQNCIAIAKIISKKIIISELKNQKTIALDNIQDPGNLGTIIRTADWFGINNIVCSVDTVDCYNAKVIQASMGSLCNVNVYYCDLNDFLNQSKNIGINIYGTLLTGKNINKNIFEPNGILLLGNEANGIAEVNLQYITHPITIEKSKSAFAESLNVAMAAAISCNTWVAF